MALVQCPTSVTLHKFFSVSWLLEKLLFTVTQDWVGVQFIVHTLASVSLNLSFNVIHKWLTISLFTHGELITCQSVLRGGGDGIYQHTLCDMIGCSSVLRTCYLAYIYISLCVCVCVCVCACAYACVCVFKNILAYIMFCDRSHRCADSLLPSLC